MSVGREGAGRLFGPGVEYFSHLDVFFRILLGEDQSHARRAQNGNAQSGPDVKQRISRSNCSALTMKPLC